ncbi:transcriptional regulator [Prauserella marina]|uniref:Putative regulatory protein, FmdB family n=1 Tax=Prauserella marina TaxID=530584 RepID=A0A222VL27_9PSEU|nr:zinc ribbon domain-containing protein [Prauserella marina]ASR34639.1 transcriptional regulator [Prauserella marina]PWV85719.1 putative FmdB family regulatory protein [Prauserella marina]SDC47421.1 putative regulatory protein, FmdB family [Prauserella marina]
MPIYDYACECGRRFEALVPSSESPAPPCDDCGNRTRRKPSAVRLGGVADPGPSRDDAPKSWRGIGEGDRDTVRHWHTAMSKREKLEQKYPELAGDRRPVLAHEGRFAAAPLRAGDPAP